MSSGRDDPASMRGYKIVNGKKTSYFHTELTDEAKALLEKNAGPKKVSKEEAAKSLKGTAARHTYDNYQAKWDKWDNDEVFEQAMAAAEADVRQLFHDGAQPSTISSDIHNVATGACDLSSPRVCIVQDGGAAKSKENKKRNSSTCSGVTCSDVGEAFQTALIRMLPACIMGVMAWFSPPQSDTGWIVFVAIAVASVAANRPHKA